MVQQQLSLGLIGLRVRRTWERSLSIYAKPESLRLVHDVERAVRDGTTFSWPNSALSDVSSLMFAYVPMTGNGDGSVLWLQTLPAFDKDEKLTDWNLVLSCGGCGLVCLCARDERASGGGEGRDESRAGVSEAVGHADGRDELRCLFGSG